MEAANGPMTSVYTPTTIREGSPKPLRKLREDVRFSICWHQLRYLLIFLPVQALQWLVKTLRASDQYIRTGAGCPNESIQLLSLTLPNNLNI